MSTEVPSTPLDVPLLCWHESICSARTDPVVALGQDQGFIATDRPVPVGTQLFLELSLGHASNAARAEIDAVVVEQPGPEDMSGFAVRFIQLDDSVRTWIGHHVATQAASSPAPAAVSPHPEATPPGVQGEAPSQSEPAQPGGAESRQPGQTWPPVGSVPVNPFASGLPPGGEPPPEVEPPAVEPAPAADAPAFADPFGGRLPDLFAEEVDLEGDAPAPPAVEPSTEAAFRTSGRAGPTGVPPPDADGPPSLGPAASLEPATSLDSLTGAAPVATAEPTDVEPAAEIAGASVVAASEIADEVPQPEAHQEGDAAVAVAAEPAQAPEPGPQIAEPAGTDAPPKPENPFAAGASTSSPPGGNPFAAGATAASVPEAVSPANPFAVGASASPMAAPPSDDQTPPSGDKDPPVTGPAAGDVTPVPAAAENPFAPGADTPPAPSGAPENNPFTAAFDEPAGPEATPPPPASDPSLDALEVDVDDVAIEPLGEPGDAAPAPGSAPSLAVPFSAAPTPIAEPSPAAPEPQPVAEPPAEAPSFAETPGSEPPAAPVPAEPPSPLFSAPIAEIDPGALSQPTLEVPQASQTADPGPELPSADAEAATAPTDPAEGSAETLLANLDPMQAFAAAFETGPPGESEASPPETLAAQPLPVEPAGSHQAEPMAVAAPPASEADAALDDGPPSPGLYRLPQDESVVEAKPDPSLRNEDPPAAAPLAPGSAAADAAAVDPGFDPFGGAAEADDEFDPFAGAETGEVSSAAAPLQSEAFQKRGDDDDDDDDFGLDVDVVDEQPAPLKPREMPSLGDAGLGFAQNPYLKAAKKAASLDDDYDPDDDDDDDDEPPLVAGSLVVDDAQKGAGETLSWGIDARQIQAAAAQRQAAPQSFEQTQRWGVAPSQPPQGQVVQGQVVQGQVVQGQAIPGQAITGQPLPGASAPEQGRTPTNPYGTPVPNATVAPPSPTADLATPAHTDPMGTPPFGGHDPFRRVPSAGETQKFPAVPAQSAPQTGSFEQTQRWQVSQPQPQSQAPPPETGSFEQTQRWQVSQPQPTQPAQPSPPQTGSFENTQRFAPSPGGTLPQFPAQNPPPPAQQPPQAPAPSPTPHTPTLDQFPAVVGTPQPTALGAAPAPRAATMDTFRPEDDVVEVSTTSQLIRAGEGGLGALVRGQAADMPNQNVTGGAQVNVPGQGFPTPNPFGGGAPSPNEPWQVSEPASQQPGLEEAPVISGTLLPDDEPAEAWIVGTPEDEDS